MAAEAPKRLRRPLSAYMLFLNSWARPAIKAENPNFTVREIARRAGELWRNLKDKSEWEHKAAKEKDDYNEAVRKYMDSMNYSRKEVAMNQDTTLPKNTPAKFSPDKNEEPIDPERVCSETTFRLKIENVSKFNDTILSPPCYVQNLPWIIKAQKRIDNTTPAKPEGLSFFLQCCSEDTSTTWSCIASADLRLLSVVPGRGPFERKINHIFNQYEYDWGFSFFMNWLDVVNPVNGYIENDAITLEVYVKAKPPRGILVAANKHSKNEGLQSNKEQTSNKKDGEKAIVDDPTEPPMKTNRNLNSTETDTLRRSEGQSASVSSVSTTISSNPGEDTTVSSVNSNAYNPQEKSSKETGEKLNRKEQNDTRGNSSPVPMEEVKQESPGEIKESNQKRFPMPIFDIKEENEQKSLVEKQQNLETTDPFHGLDPFPEVESGMDQRRQQNDYEMTIRSCSLCRNKLSLEEDLAPTGSDDGNSLGATSKELIATTPWTVCSSGNEQSDAQDGEDIANGAQSPKRKAHSATVSGIPEVASKEASRKRTAAKPRTKPILTKAGAGVAKKRKISAPQQVEAVSNGACGKRKTDLMRSKDLQEAPVRKQKKTGQKNAQIASHIAPTNAANGPLGIGQPLADQGHRPELFPRSSSSGVRIHNDLSQPQQQPIVPEANLNPPQQNAFSMFGGPHQLPVGTSNNINQMLTTLWEQFIGLILSNISNQMDQVAVQSSALYRDPQQLELLCSIFGCIAFLNGRCVKPYCRYPHIVSTEEEVFQKLSSRSHDDIVTSYRFLAKRDDLFGKYFPVFAQVMGLKNMHLQLVATVADCEQLKRPIAYYKHIVEGLKASGTRPEQAVRLILSKHTKRSFHQISVLIELILDAAAEAIPTFLPTLQEFSRVKDYYFDVAAVNRLLELCVRSTLPNKDLDQFVCNLLLKLPAGEEQLVNTGLLLEFTEKVRSDPILNLDVEEIAEKYGSVAAMKPHQ